MSIMYTLFEFLFVAINNPENKQCCYLCLILTRTRVGDTAGEHREGDTFCKIM